MKPIISDSELYEIANQARKRAYAPYSNITVGAALLTSSGKVYTGVNIENAAHAPGVCAERCAIFTAVANGERDFVKIAVAGGNEGSAPREVFAPCGVCRQVMAELCGSDFKVIFGKGYEKSFGELLPFSFDKDSIK